VYAEIRAELDAGGRVYIVCPLVDAARAADADGGDGGAPAAAGAGGGDASRRSVMAEFERLSRDGALGGRHRVGLLHGRLSGEDKAAALRAFSRRAARGGAAPPARRARGKAPAHRGSAHPAGGGRHTPPMLHAPRAPASTIDLPPPQKKTPRSGETPVLIASTVVEVGIDEPEASVMLVESAHCFGMAQLHQLRGRVGRGARPSRCFLMAPPPGPGAGGAGGGGESGAAARLRVMERSHNGLHIAEADLRARWARGQQRARPDARAGRGAGRRRPLGGALLEVHEGAREGLSALRFASLCKRGPV
jgi:ATP-dependent DNA helicase RecG